MWWSPCLQQDDDDGHGQHGQAGRNKLARDLAPHVRAVLVPAGGQGDSPSWASNGGVVPAAGDLDDVRAAQRRPLEVTAGFAAVIPRALGHWWLSPCPGCPGGYHWRRSL